MHVDIQNTINAYKCIECTEQVTTNNDDTTFVDLDLRGKMRQLGMKPSTFSGSDEVRAQKKKLNAILQDMSQCLPQNEIDEVKNTKPRPYPSAVKMNPQAVDKHVLSGRRTEISLMLYNIHKCKCCGRVQPSHIDSTFVDKDKSPPLKIEHLVNKHYRVWHCNCWGFCKGSQFFSNVKDMHINEYKRNHNGNHPSDF
jgi:hypothetical protein